MALWFRRCQCLVASLLLTGGTLAGAASSAATAPTQIDTSYSKPATTQAARILPVPEQIPAAKASLGEGDLAQLEKQLWSLINWERSSLANQAETGGNALPLKWNEKLAEVARTYSEDMLQRGFYAHVNPEGLTPAMRVAAAGIAWQAEAENIAVYNSVAGAQAAFMDEPPFVHNHRSNILSPKYTDVGVGIVRAPDGMYYITEEFVKTPTDEFVAAQSLSFSPRPGSRTASGR